MKRFFDLHVKLNLEDEAQTESMIEKISELGYRGVGLSLPSSIHLDKTNALQKLCNDHGLDFVKRVDLKASNTRELLSMLNRVRKTFEVVSVFCSSKLVARQAAKDRRVDLLSFDYSTRCRFDRAEAELASGTNTALEIDLTNLLNSWGRYLVRLLNELRTEVSIADKYEVPVILSSGASNIWMLRSPRDWASVTILFDFGEEEAMRALSDIPTDLVCKNRAKLSPGFLLPGVNIVGEN